MTATTVTPIGGLTPDLDLRGVRRFTTAVSDTFAVMARNIIAYRRVPQLLVFSTIQPVVFVLLFRYVFGGAISVPGVPYVDFLMPGIFVQTVTFGALNTAIGLATDLNQGLIERFRSLPMARSAVLAGRTLADLVRNVFVVALMFAVGFAVGWRVHTGLVPLIGAVLLILLFGYALSWIFATVGLVVKRPRDGTGGCVSDLGAARVRIQRVRARRVDARLAPALGGAPTRLGRHHGRSRSHDRRSHDVRPHRGRAVVRRDPGRGGAVRRAPLPPRHLDPPRRLGRARPPARSAAGVLTAQPAARTCPSRQEARATRRPRPTRGRRNRFEGARRRVKRRRRGARARR